MKDYFIKMEGSYDGMQDFHDSGIFKEDKLKDVVYKYLLPYIEQWKDNEESESNDKLVERVIKDKGFYYEELGYGDYLEIKIEEIK